MASAEWAQAAVEISVERDGREGKAEDVLAIYNETRKELAEDLLDGPFTKEDLCACYGKKLGVS